MKSFVYKAIATSFIVICQLSFVNATFAQTEVTAGVTFGKKFGVTYMLPKTELVIEAQATKQTYQPGEFSRYAERYLRMGGVKQEAETAWSLDKVTVKVVGVPDKENIYFVEMKDRTTAPLMELTPDGIVRSINLPYEGVKNTVQTEEPQPTEPELDPRSFLTEEIITANSSAKMAELVAREIYNIRESKNALLRGEADNLPKDGAQLQIMLDNLNLQEKALTQMFQGKVTTEAHHFSTRVTPEEMQDKVVFRFSKKLGFVDADDLAGEPVGLTIFNKHVVPEQPSEPNDGKAGKSIVSFLSNGSKEALEGVAYNVPGKADVRLTYNHQSLFNGDMSFTQFGTKEYLAAQLFNKNTVTKVQFDVNTGALLKIDR